MRFSSSSISALFIFLILPCINVNAAAPDCKGATSSGKPTFSEDSKGGKLFCSVNGEILGHCTGKRDFMKIEGPFTMTSDSFFYSSTS